MVKINKIIFLHFFIISGLSAQEYQSSKTVKALATGITTVSSIANKIIESNKQQKLQELQLQQNQALMNQLGPQVAPPSALSSFPNCPRPAANPPVPNGVCNNLADQNSLLQANMFMALSYRHLEFINLYSSPTQDGPVPVGLSCMETSLKKMQDGLQNKLNGMQNLTDQIRKAQQAFAEESQSLKKNMELLNLELAGGKSNDINAKGHDYSKYFPGCSGIIPQSALIGTETGLIGIRDSMNSTGQRKAARDFLDNENVYEKEIDTVVERMIEDLQKNGIDDWIEGGALPSKWTRGGLTNFKGMEDVIKEEVAELQLKRKRITKELSEFGYAPPRFDNNFDQNFKDFSLGAKTYFKKSYIDKCALTSGGSGDNKGLGLTKEELLKGITNLYNKSGGTTTNNYKSQVEKILDSDDLLQDKISQINDLDKIYGKGVLKIRYRDENKRNRYDTVADFLNKASQKCEQQYGQRNIYSKNKDRVNSYKTKVDQIQKSVNELNVLYKTFRSKLATSIKDKVKHCSGAPSKEGQCSPGVLSPKNPNFCLAHAKQCSERTRACYNRAEALITDRKQKLSSYANIYNQRVAELAAQQENYLNQVKAKVIADSEYLKQFFPGASFVLPPRLGVALPPPIDSPYGVQLRGGGDLSFLNNLPAQLEKLQKSMFEQGKKILKEAEEQIEKEKMTMENNKKRFQEIIDTCNEKMAEYQNRAQEEANKNAEKILEDQQKKGEFCQRFNRLRMTNPVAGCDGTNSPSELYGDAIKIASLLDNKVLPLIGAYESVCKQSQNEADRATARPNTSGPVTLLKDCENSNNDWNQVMDSKKALLLSQAQKEKRPIIEKYLNDEIDSSALGSNEFAEKVKQLKTLTNYKGLRSKDIINDLNGPQPDKKEVKLKEVQEELKDLKGRLSSRLDPSIVYKIKQDIDRINRDIVNNPESSRERLSKLLNEKEGLIAKEDEKNRELLGLIFNDLEEQNNQIQEDYLNSLPEPKVSGPGSRYSSKFSGSDDENNICNYAKDTLVKKSISSCQNETNFNSCFDQQLERNQRDLPVGSDIYYLNEKLNVISNIENKMDVDFAWNRLGQQAAGLCSTQLDAKREAKEIEGFGEFTDSLQDLIRGIGVER